MERRHPIFTNDSCAVWRLSLPLLGALFILLIVIGVCAADAASFQSTSPPVLTGDILSLEDGWSTQDGEIVALPGDLPFGAQGRCVLTLPLPDVRMDAHCLPVLYIQSKYVNLSLSLEGVPLGNCVSRPDGRRASQGRAYLFVTLPADYAGKTLQIEAVSSLGKGFPFWQSSPLLGDYEQVVWQLIRQEMPNLLIVFAILCFGIMLLVLGFLIQIGRRDTTFFYSGVLAMLFSFYCLSTTNTATLLLQGSSILYTLEFLLLSLLPVPLLCLLARHCRPHCQRILKKVSGLSLVNFLLQTLLHLLSPWELRHTVFITHVLLACALFMVVGSLAFGIQKRETRFFMMLSFLPLTLGTLYDLVAFYLPNSDWTAPGYQIGVLVLILAQLGYLIYSYLAYYKENLHAQVYRKMAFADQLTGLGNRAALDALIGWYETRPAAAFHSVWCISADLNNLKPVNDTYGHAEGDRLIQAAAALFPLLPCQKEHLFRAGGDEFLLFAFDVSKADLERGLACFQDALRQYNAVHHVPLSLAIGFDCLRGPADTLDDLIARADAHMYENKRKAKAAESASAPASHDTTPDDAG